ncbi:MAG: hypothetical protein ACRDGA_05625, partial [Bacteroidota bacterium]
ESMFLRYYQTLQAIRIHRLESQLSLKLPDLAFHLDLLRRLLDYAAEHTLFIQLDSLDVSSAAASLAVLEKTHTMYNNIGYTLPARWKRSFSDAEQLVGMGIPVRVVKGQWPDSTNHERHLRERYLELIAVLSGRAVKVVVATHDQWLAQSALRRLHDAGTPSELEQMIGLPLAAETFARARGIPTRLYIPYGYPYLPYNIRDIWLRPAIMKWMVRDLLLDREGKLVRFQ